MPNNTALYLINETMKIRDVDIIQKYCSDISFSQFFLQSFFMGILLIVVIYARMAKNKALAEVFIEMILFTTFVMISFNLVVYAAYRGFLG
jgi:hypothetical protein